MFKRTAGRFAFLLGPVAYASMALAADPVPVVVAPEVMPATVPSLAGYVAAHFGRDRGGETQSVDEVIDFEEAWIDTAIGGAGRAAWWITPSFALQLDAWANLWESTFEGGTDNWGEGGFGAHVVYQTAGGLQLGGLLSVGREDGTAINVAAEAAQSFGNFRLAIQTGYTVPIAGEDAEEGERHVYVTAAGTYFITPNFAITAHAAIERWWETSDPGDTQRERNFNYGVRAELGLGDTPFSIYVGFQGEHWWETVDEAPVTNNGGERTLFAGVRMLLGRDNLRDLSAAVPFADYNPVFGDQFAPR